MHVLGETCFKMFVKHCASSTVILVKGHKGRQLGLYEKILDTTDDTLHMEKRIWVVKYCVSGLTKTH